MISTNELLTVLTKNEDVNFRCIKTLPRRRIFDVSGLLNDAKTQLEEKNEQGYEIYFVPNGGGYKNEEITQINAVFIDLDCGRDDNGNYFSLNIVEEYKEQKIQAIKNFPFKPTAIIETRNGLHVYWGLEEGSSVEQFIECGERLISYFDADPSVKKPCNLMRVPGFYWCKDIKNKFLITTKEFNDVRYNILDIINALPAICENDEDLSPTNKEEYKSLLIIGGTKTPNLANTIDFIKAQDVQALQMILKPISVKLNSHLEVYDYLKRQDLGKLLGVNSKQFSCVFHEDNNPSAGIVLNKENGHQIYVCQSSKCKFSRGTVIEVVQALTGLSVHETLRFLRKIYKISYNQTEWQRAHQELLEANLEFVVGKGLQEQFPYTYTLVKSYIPILAKMLEIATENIYTSNFTDNSGHPIFFTSVKHLVKRCSKDRKTIIDAIGFLTYLGFFKKINEEEIPKFLLDKATSEAKKNKHKYVVGFYSIPAYDYDVIEFIQHKSEEYKKLGFTKKGWGREIILRALGEEEANRVYPQMHDMQIPKLNEEISAAMEQITCQLIAKKGWTTEEEILNLVDLKFNGQKEYKKKQLKRFIPELLEKYALSKIRLNRILKQKTGITCKGYPFIIASYEFLSNKSEIIDSNILMIQDYFSRYGNKLYRRASFNAKAIRKFCSTIDLK